MRIFYVNVIEQNAGWGAEWFVNRGLHALGHETYCIDYKKNRNRLYRQFLHVPQCDVFFLQRGDFFPLPLIRSVQVPRFFWASELVSRCRDQDRLLRSNLFSHVFLRTPQCIETVVSRGWLKREQCSILLSGFDPEIHKPLPNVARDIDVLFVGSLTPRRQTMLKAIGSRCNLVIASAFGTELVQLFSRAKIVLNIHAEEFLDTETRVYEALGCGAFLLSETLSAENPFTSGELVQFQSLDELQEKIEYYLSHDAERDAIAKRGYEAAINGHTYTHRASQIVETMAVYINQSQAKSGETVRRDWHLHVFGLSELPLRAGQEAARIIRGAGRRVKRLLKVSP